MMKQKFKHLLLATAIFCFGMFANEKSWGQILWSSATGSAYLTTGNWTGGAVPTSAQIAQ